MDFSDLLYGDIEQQEVAVVEDESPKTAPIVYIATQPSPDPLDSLLEDRIGLPWIRLKHLPKLHDLKQSLADHWITISSPGVGMTKLYSHGYSLLQDLALDVQKVAQRRVLRLMIFYYQNENKWCLNSQALIDQYWAPPHTQYTLGALHLGLPREHEILGKSVPLSSNIIYFQRRPLRSPGIGLIRPCKEHCHGDAMVLLFLLE